MTHRERLVTGRVVSEHIVQLFDGNDTRAEGVAAFLAAGLAEGSRALVVAKSSHWRAIAADLTRRGIDVPGALSSGTLTTLDAQDMLRTVMDGERPVRDRFRATVGSLVETLATGDGPPLRIYGEMVEVLAEMANFAGAACLEELWNELAREYSFCLLCGYSSGHFGPEHTGRALHAICRAHCRVQTGPGDPLGEWLTRAARV